VRTITAKGQRNADPSPKRKAAPKEKDRSEVLCGVGLDSLSLPFREKCHTTKAINLRTGVVLQITELVIYVESMLPICTITPFSFVLGG